MRFFEGQSFLPDRTFQKRKVDYRGSVYWPEQRLLHIEKCDLSGRAFVRKCAVFFAERTKKHVDYQEFLLGRSTLPTMTRLSIMRLAPVWCIFLFATFFFKTLNYSFHNSTLLTTRSLLLEVKLLYQRDSNSSTLKSLQTAHALERELLCKYETR